MVSIKNVGLLEIILLGRLVTKLQQPLPPNRSSASEYRILHEILGRSTWNASNLAGTENVFIPLIPNIKDAIGWQPHSGESMLKNNR